MNLDALLEDIGNADVRFPVPEGRIAPRGAPETVDALFHLPLLAIAIMTASRDAPFSTVALGRVIAGILVERFAALRNTSTVLERSVTLRRRAVEALVFLELAGLVVVSDDERREISIST